MNKIVLKVENISKKYRLGLVGTGTISHDLNRWWSRTFKKNDPYEELLDNDNLKKNESIIWALKNIDFNIQEGEVVGIIGQNGSGKSTLLKILSQVTIPTTGKVKVKGRIASLLEVGTGFHPELTGKENIYLNGAILGMTKKEVDSKYDEIVDFSGVKKFIDTPVKRYSSGMKVRLGFAVAAHLDPEILVVDEVLAVGDDEFQNKCLGKLKEVSSSGRTVLFVSHNMNSISKLCTRCILLEKGQNIFDGSPEQVIEKYLNNNSNRNTNTSKVNFDKSEKEIQIKSIEIIDGIKHNYNSKINIEIFFIVNFLKRLGYYCLLAIYDLKGNLIYLTSDNDLGHSKINRLDPGVYNYLVCLPSKILKPGNYFLTVSISSKGVSAIDKKERVLKFNIEDKDSFRSSQDGGYRSAAIIAPEINWNFKTVSNEC